MAAVQLRSAPNDLAVFPPTVTEADAALLRDLEGKLPPEWVIEVEMLPDLDWAATVHRGEVPMSEMLMFVVFRWPGHAICSTHWMDGSQSVMDGSPALAPVLDMIPSAIFAGAGGYLAMVEAGGWQEVRH
jgi:hypothetical protein